MISNHTFSLRQLSFQQQMTDMIPFSLKCKAFPNGLPDTIRQGRWDHREPFEGDNGILYEPVDPSLTTAPPYAKNKIK